MEVQTTQKGILDRLESKEFTKNVIMLATALCFLMTFLIVVILSRKELDKVYNLLYLFGGLILGALGKGKIKNGT